MKALAEAEAAKKKAEQQAEAARKRAEEEAEKVLIYFLSAWMRSK